MVSEVKHRLALGSVVGKQSIRAFASTDSLGERYVSFFGSTAHLMDVYVPSLDANFPSLSDYERIVSHSAKIFREPCVIHYVAAGKDNRLPWMRADHPSGVEADSFGFELDTANLTVSVDTHEAMVNTLRDFLDALTGELDAVTALNIVGDILEGTAAIHNVGLAIGAISLDTIFFDYSPVDSTPCVRIGGYGAESLETAKAAADMPRLGALLRLIAKKTLAGSSVAENLSTFADKLQLGDFATATDAYAAFIASAAELGCPRHDRAEALATAEQAERDADAKAEQRQNRAAEREGDEPMSADFADVAEVSGSRSEVMQLLLNFLRFAGLMFLVILVGVGVYLWLKWSDEKGRTNNANMAVVSYSAITVIPTSEDKSDFLPSDVCLYTAEQLNYMANSGDPVANARLAVETVVNTNGFVAQADYDTSCDRIRLFARILRERARKDKNAAFFLGYATLLGLGVEADHAEAMSLLEQASNSGQTRASMLLGDWFAGEYDLPYPGGMERADRDHKAIVYYRRAMGRDVNSSAWNDAVNRAVAVMQRNTPGLLARDNDYLDFLRRAANQGNISAMAMLATPSDLVGRSPEQAIGWLRNLTILPSAPDPVRAWAQYRMGVFLEQGRGVKPSESTARMWFEHSAELGFIPAITKMVEYCSSGKGSESGAPDAAAASDWRKRRSEGFSELHFFELFLLPVRMDEIDILTEDAISERLIPDFVPTLPEVQPVVASQRTSGKPNKGVLLPIMSRRSSASKKSSKAPALTPLTPLSSSKPKAPISESSATSRGGAPASIDWTKALNPVSKTTTK